MVSGAYISLLFHRPSFRLTSLRKELARCRSGILKMMTSSHIGKRSRGQIFPFPHTIAALTHNVQADNRRLIKSEVEFPGLP